MTTEFYGPSTMNSCYLKFRSPDDRLTVIAEDEEFNEQINLTTKNFKDLISLTSTKNNEEKQKVNNLKQLKSLGNKILFYLYHT